jgi:myo-inositol 2-dehydrogenase / D-chiro-inositol 1-dehydrogenase
MRIGVARVGRIGAFHARTLSSIDDIDTLVLADTLPTATDTRAAVAAGELGWVHALRATTLDPAPPTAEYAEHRAARVDEVRA